MAEHRRGDPAGASAPRELLGAADVARTIARIAHQIIEKTSAGADGMDKVVLIGIPTRGAVLARRLAAAIAEFEGTAVPVGSPRRSPSSRARASGSAPSTPRCTATTCGAARPARSRTPRCPRAGSTTRSSCSSTTC